MQIPNELYLAAKVDGTSDFKYLTKVMIPICSPTMITIVILKVIECWNSYDSDSMRQISFLFILTLCTSSGYAVHYLVAEYQKQRYERH